MIKLFSDTSANLPVMINQKYNITILAFNYMVNDVVVPYYDGVDFDGKTFYGNMRKGARVKTSLVGTGIFEEAFEKEILDGNDIIYVGMSGGISGTANSARLAKEDLLEKYPNARIETFDSYAASLGEGLQVIRAAKLIEEGYSFEKIVEILYEERDRMCQYFTVDDLKYLKNTGRVSNAAAFVGNALSIKPILTGNEIGQIVNIDKARGFKNALKNLADRYDKLAADKAATIGIADADNREGTNYLIERLREKGFTGEALVVDYEPVTGSHVGPGTVAMFYYGIHK